MVAKSNSAIGCAHCGKGVWLSQAVLSDEGPLHLDCAVHRQEYGYFVEPGRVRNPNA